jgi:uncharacterized protein YndB with AHSA1/START domain
MTEDRWTDEREIRISSDPETVWASWAEPEHVRRWFSDEARGSVEEGAELVHEFEGHGEHRYRVVEVDVPRRLVLDGEMDGRAFRQIVEIRRDGGTTILRLVHSGFGTADPDSEIVQGIDSGWTMALALMKHYAERYFGRDKTSVGVFRPARFEYESLLADRYLDRAGLGAWLTDGSAGIANGSGRVRRGDPVALRLRSGRALSGRILALTDHEVSLTWDQLEGVLELKAFGAGPDARMLGVRLATWSRDEPLIESVRAELIQAVGRLAD